MRRVAAWREAMRRYPADNEIVIEKDIPLPVIRTTAFNSKYAALLRKMEVGDSFFVPKTALETDDKRLSLDARIRSWGSRQSPSRHFAARKQADGGTRFWRVK
jgi:hypothetical protein